MRIDPVVYWNPEQSPLVGTRWRHVKRGSTYKLLGLCRIEATNTGAFAYQCESSGDIWIRPRDEFLNGSFVQLEGEQP